MNLYRSIGIIVCSAMTSIVMYKIYKPTQPATYCALHTNKCPQKSPKDKNSPA